MATHIYHTTIILSAWLLLFLSFYGWGNLFAIILKISNEPNTNYFTLPWIGWSFTLLLFNIIHLFMPLNYYPSIIIYTLGVIIFIVFKWPSKPKFKNISLTLMDCLIGFLFLLAAFYVASRAMMTPTLYDSGLYHFQSVRWLNECAIVPGLGNLHGRLAFNQSFFTYLASLNIYPLFGKGHNVGSSFLLMLLILQILGSLKNTIIGCKNKIQIPLVTIATVLFIPASLYVMVLTSLSSPNPDIASFLLQIILFISYVKVLAMLEKGESKPALVAFIIILSATAITIKLSNAFFVGLLAFIVLFLNVRLIWENKNYRQVIIKAFIFATMIIVVWSIRGVINSGYPAYPSTIGRIYLEWTLPVDSVHNMASRIYSWARQPGLNPNEVLGDWNWLTPWVKRVLLSISGFFYIIFPSLLAFLFISWTILLGFKYRKAVSRVNYRFAVLYFLPVVLNIGFWFFTAPSIRLANALFFILPLSAFLFHFTVIKNFRVPFNRHRNKVYIILIAFILISMPGGYFLRKKVFDLSNISTVGFQPVITAELISRETDSGLILWLPANGDQTWNSPIPSTPYFNPALKLRTEDNICEGFISE